MHLLLITLVFLLAYRFGNWREWLKYNHTIFYVITCNLLYNFFCHDKMLWEYQPDYFLMSHTIIDLLYTFITLPAITLLYLSFYPFNKSLFRQIRFIGQWVLSSMAIEYVFYKFDRLLLHNNYSYWMDFLFYPVMYSMIRLHYTRPILTYVLSMGIISFMLWYFQIPLK
ncbi:hypothetical protein M3175_14245 [Robertmurraya korlensis]|uniref:CBO0543 family protein n=1 Tax=Robertmurraya korlensis TaxID=519977 RepID=UPI00203E63E6|nr:CBO0543 family protein [Robertmurraya korlensis]MCM3601897.1 hypothetical protein [Robertmurraya korlensis]